MKRFQPYLHDEEYEAVQAEASRRNLSISRVLRELVHDHIVKQLKKVARDKASHV